MVGVVMIAVVVTVVAVVSVLVKARVVVNMAVELLVINVWVFESLDGEVVALEFAVPVS